MISNRLQMLKNSINRAWTKVNFKLKLHILKNKYLLFFSFKDTIEEKGEAAFLKMIQTELGGWPILDPNYDENKETPLQKLVRYRKLESKPIFDFYIGPNPKDPARWIIRVI